MSRAYRLYTRLGAPGGSFHQPCRTCLLLNLAATDRELAANVCQATVNVGHCIRIASDIHLGMSFPMFINLYYSCLKYMYFLTVDYFLCLYRSHTKGGWLKLWFFLLCVSLDVVINRNDTCTMFQNVQIHEPWGYGINGYREHIYMF